MRVREAIGRVVGGIISPALLGGSLFRGARVFHPDGVVYRAEVRPLSHEGKVGALAERLAGPALVRLSGALWRWRGGRAERRPDVLGVAIRFRSTPEAEAEAAPGDQDLLFESFRTLWMLPIALFTTNRTDFPANVYYALLPFDVAGLGRAKFRLVPMATTTHGENRRERLENAVAAGDAVLRLEVRELGRGGAWVAVADVVLLERVWVDTVKLRMNPFRAGRGIVPSGLIQATRAAAYAASQLGRSLTSPS